MKLLLRAILEQAKLVRIFVAICVISNFSEKDKQKAYEKL